MFRVLSLGQLDTILVLVVAAERCLMNKLRKKLLFLCVAGLRMEQGKGLMLGPGVLL